MYFYKRDLHQNDKEEKCIVLINKQLPDSPRTLWDADITKVLFSCQLYRNFL